MPKQIEIEIAAQMRRYETSLNGALKTAARFDSQMRALQNTAKAVDKRINAVNGDIKLSIQADTGALDRAEAKVDAIDGMTPDVTVTVDSTALDTAESKVDAIDGLTPDVTISADSGALDQAQTKIGVIDGSSPDVTVDVNASALDDISTQIANLNTTATISLVVQGAALAQNALSGVPVLNSFSDAQRAENIGAARTTDGFSDTDMAAIEQAYASGFAGSMSELAEVGILIKRAGGDISESLLPVLQVAASQGEDVTEVFTAMNALVKSRMVPTFAAAGDALTVLFQEGGDAAGDGLDTVREYSSQFAAAGVSIEGFFGFLTAGLEAGAINTDKLADSVKEGFGVRLTEALADPESAPAKVLARLFSPEELGDMSEQREAGTLAADAYFEAVIERAEQVGTGFDLFELLGSAAEDLTLPVVQSLTFEEIEIPEGVGAEASAAIFNDLNSDLMSLLRTFEIEAVKTFQVAGEGLDKWVTGGRNKISALAEEIRSGTALPEALEIALEAPGLADQLRNFESDLANFIINLLDGLGQLVAVIPGANAAPIKNTVANLSAGQLVYDLEFAVNETEIEQAITLAMARGVSNEQVETALTTAVTSIARDSRLIDAQTAVNQAENLSQTASVTFTPTTSFTAALEGVTLEPVTVTVPIDPTIPPEERQAAAIELARQSDEVIALYQNGYVAGGTLGAPKQITVDAEMLAESIDTTAAQAAIDLARFAMSQYATVAEDVGTSATPSIEALTGLNFQFSEMESTADGATARADVTATAITNLGDDADTAGAQLALFYDGTATSSEDALARLAAAHDTYLPPAIKWWEEYQQKAYDAIAAAGGVIPLTPTAPPSGAGSGSAPGRAIGGDVLAGSPYTVGEQGRELFIPGADGFIIPHGLTEALLALPSMAGGGAITNNYNTVNANININSQGTAQLMGGASRMAKAIRGY